MTDTLDDVLRSTFAAHADDVRVPIGLVPAARRSGRRRAGAMRVGALALAAVVVAGAALGATHLGGSDGVRSIPPAAAPVSAASLFAPFPLTPTYLPPGLAAPRTGRDGVDDWSTLTYLPTVLEPAQASPSAYPNRAMQSRFTITVSPKPIAVTQVSAPFVKTLNGAPATANDGSRLYLKAPPNSVAAVHTTPATVYDGSKLYHEVTVTWLRARNQYVAITGDLRYAQVSTVLAVANSLQDRAFAPTPPFRLAFVPAAYANVGSYDSTELSLEPVGTHNPNTYSSQGNGVLIKNLQGAFPELTAGPVLRVGARPGWAINNGLLVRTGPDTFLQLVSKTVGTRELTRIAAAVTVLPAAQTEPDLTGIGG